MTTHKPGPPHLLVTGATGYIGGRLVPVMESAGVRLRCLARQPAALRSRVSATTETVGGDLLDPASLDRAPAGIDVASFELIRALVERLPVMICPRWVSTLAQPIGIDDVLAYLAAAMRLPDSESRTFEIGGADHASYGDVMREYAGQRGLTRVMIAVPLLTPRLSSLWLGLVTPVYAPVGRELIAGLKNRSVVTDRAALAVFPIRPIGLRDAIGRAIRYEDRAFALTRWSDSRSTGGATASPADTRSVAS